MKSQIFAFSISFSKRSLPISVTCSAGTCVGELTLEMREPALEVDVKLFLVHSYPP